MTSLRQKAQALVEALTMDEPYVYLPGISSHVADLREALAAPEEPVAWRPPLDLVLACVDAEEELDGPMPQSVLDAVDSDPSHVLRATVRATKGSIRARITALGDEP